MKRTMTAMTATALVLAGVLVGGCNINFSPQRPTSEPDVRGVITAVDLDGTGNGTMRVVWTEDAAIGAKAKYDAAEVTLGDATIPDKKVGDTFEPVTTAELTPGTIVQVWFTGKVKESYPVQADATQVEVLGTYSGALPTPVGP